MDESSRRFTRVRIINGNIYLKMLEERSQLSLVLTLEVRNYSKLRSRVFYYKAAKSSEFRWCLELSQLKGSLFTSLTTNVHDKVVDFSISNADYTKIRIGQGKKIASSFENQTIYITEFCKKVILDPENKFLPGDVLTVMCKYNTNYVESMNLLLPVYLLKLQPPPIETEESAYFKNLYRTLLGADFTINVKDGWVRVHKTILCYRSIFFDKLFQIYDALNYKIHEFRLDTSSHIMDSVLLYLYCGEIKELNAESRSEMLRVALHLKIQSLIKFIQLQE